MRCAHDPDVDAVHDSRTGTRRIGATLEAALRNSGLHEENRDDPRVAAARAWERLLKKVRRAAAPVRDLDVQRRLLKDLAPENVAGQVADVRGELVKQAETLDHALHAERDERVEPLKKSATKWAEKLDEEFSGFAEAMARGRSRRTRKPDAARVALDAFARLSARMQQLHAGNLHDFRKGVKRARYMAEADAGDARADAVAKVLKRLQDAIGDWHDWVMLAEEADKYLGEDGVGLTAEIEREREERFASAMQLTERMRGRLMGEWQGTRRRGRRAAQATDKEVSMGAAASRHRKPVGGVGGPASLLKSAESAGAPETAER